MKKVITALVVLGLCGCNDFLEETSQNQVRPSSISDMEKIIEGEAYFDKTEGRIFSYGTEFMTDDLQCNEEQFNSGQDAVKELWRRMFCFDITMFDEGNEDEKENVDYWYVPYECIKGCNIALDYLDDMTGDDEKREYLRGEALALRGYYYLNLVNFFSLPYNYGEPTQNMGVPLKLTSGITEEKLNRGTVAQVYEQIEKDLSEGARLMRQYPRELVFTRMNGLAAYALLSRMYLYMEQWDKAIQYADSVLNVKNDLLDLNQTLSGSVWDNVTSDEIIWACYMSETAVYAEHLFFSSLYKTAWTPSNELVNVFGLDVDAGTDIRANLNNANAYLMKGSKAGISETWVAGVKKSRTYSYGAGVRTAEVYLNRAEAYIRQYVETNDATTGQKGLDDLNILRRHRFTTDYVDKKLSQFATPEELLDFCLRERRRELCHEGNFRWFDLRRTGMPRIDHEFFYVETEKFNYTLEEEDPRYALPLPQTVLQKNNNLRQNQY